MNHPTSPHGTAMAATAVVLALLPGCATRGYPTHGGGKRFSHEQEIVARSIDGALAQIDFTQVKALLDDESKRTSQVAVQIYPMSHSGGGVQTGSTGLFGNLFGVSPVLGAAEQGVGTPASPMLPAGSGNYYAFGFESADDLRYLMGRLVERLGQGGLQCVEPKKGDARSVLCLLVSELGIDQSDFNALVYSEKQLVASTAVDAFVVGPTGPNQDEVKSHPVGRGASSWRFREDYFLGFGPLSGGAPEEVQR